MSNGSAASMPPGDPATFAEAHRSLVADRSIQFDLAAYTPPEVPSWFRWLIEMLTTPAARYTLWILLAAAALLILYFVARGLAGRRWPWKQRAEEEEEDAESWRPEEQVARSLLREADTLAAEGRFDEAAHLLLFRSIEDIDLRRPRLVRPALTSRDIAEAQELPAGPRQAFAAIVLLVEKSLFGGRKLGADDWRACRAAYEEFAFAGAWG